MKNLKDTVTDENGNVCCIIRTYGAGVHIGFVEKKDITIAGIHVVLRNTKRIWFWSGANSLSQLASTGSTKRKDCKISVSVDYNEMIAIEVIPVTQKSYDDIFKGAEWKL